MSTLATNKPIDQPRLERQLEELEKRLCIQREVISFIAGKRFRLCGSPSDKKSADSPSESGYVGSIDRLSNFLVQNTESLIDIRDYIDPLL